MTSAQQQPTHRVSFLGIDIATTNVIGFGNTNGISNYMVMPAGIGIPIPIFVAQNPQFWIENDWMGVSQLCTTKTIGSQLTGQFQLTIGGTVFNRTANSFDTIHNDQDGTDIHLPKGQV